MLRSVLGVVILLLGFVWIFFLLILVAGSSSADSSFYIALILGIGLLILGGRVLLGKNDGASPQPARPLGNQIGYGVLKGVFITGAIVIAVYIQMLLKRFWYEEDLSLIFGTLIYALSAIVLTEKYNRGVPLSKVILNFLGVIIAYNFLVLLIKILL